MNNFIKSILFSLKYSIITTLTFNSFFILIGVLWSIYRYFLVGVPWFDIQLFIDKVTIFLALFSALFTFGLFMVLLIGWAMIRDDKIDDSIK